MVALAGDMVKYLSTWGYRTHPRPRKYGLNSGKTYCQATQTKFGEISALSSGKLGKRLKRFDPRALVRLRLRN